LEKSYKDRKEHIKQQKSKQKEIAIERTENEEVYCIISFDSIQNKVAFLEMFDFDINSKYIKGEKLLESIE